MHISNWTTPEISPKRFATWFFVGEVAGGEAVADGTETDALHWFRPDEAFAARDAGDIELAPPQYVTLLWLRDHATVADAMRAARRSATRSTSRRASTSSKATARCACTAKTSRTTIAAASTTPGPATASTSRDTGWEYVRD